MHILYLLPLTLFAMEALCGAVAPLYSKATKCPNPPKKYKNNDERLRTVYKNFWDGYMYPKNIEQAKTINSTVFSDTVQGRVDMTSTFDGPELNTEYVFGLFVSLAENPNVVSLLPVPISYQLRSYAAGGDFISGTIVGQFKNFITNVTRPMVVHLDLLLNECDQVQQYDALFDRAEWFLAETKQDFTPIVAAQLNIKNQTLISTAVLEIAVKAGLVKSVCSIHTQYCKGADKQYDDEAACTKFLNNLEVGASYQLGQNTIGCRNLHSNMISLRPSVHCPHIGPTGGGMCVERDYNKVAAEVYFKKPMMMSG